VTRLVFFFPKGPKTQFPPSTQAASIQTGDFLFHPKHEEPRAGQKHGADDDDDEEEEASTTYYPSRRRRTTKRKRW
jgi:hypothetical protein